MVQVWRRELKIGRLIKTDRRENNVSIFRILGLLKEWLGRVYRIGRNLTFDLESILIAAKLCSFVGRESLGSFYVFLVGFTVGFC